LVASALFGQTEFFPLEKVRAGMRGTGKTVFSGSRIEEFQVEILGVLENVGPKQSLILARLAGGPLEKTGVLQGMSGSPVYLEGRLLGAVSMAFPFSKEPVAAIRPIGEMLLSARGGKARTVRARVSLLDDDLTRPFTPPEEVRAGGTRLIDIATPVSFGGLTRNTVERFAPQLRALGLEPAQGMSGGGKARASDGASPPFEPGSMITVQLMSGDMSIGADGTVTYVEGKNVYAFGHRFLSIGNTELPFARSEVLTLLPSLASSFKISAVREWMGTILDDRSTAVSGLLGRRAATVPLSIEVTRRGEHAGGARSCYRMEMVNDRYLAPFLVQMAVYSAIDATERTVGSSTLALNGVFEFRDGTTPIRLNNSFSGEFSVPQQVSLATSIPLAYALQSGFDSLQLKNVKLEIESFDEKKQAQIEQVWTSRQEVRAGDAVELTVVLASPNGAEVKRKVTYEVPVGAPAGPLYFTVADGTTTNLTEIRQFVGAQPRSPSQLVSLVNSLRGNTKAYVRIWRADANYDVQGHDFPSPPPSLEQVLVQTQAAVGGGFPGRSSKVAELEIDAGGVVVTGSKTVQVDIKG
jgi:hypothetical protein